jgi:hypothetical protein
MWGGLVMNTSSHVAGPVDTGQTFVVQDYWLASVPSTVMQLKIPGF